MTLAPGSITAAPIPARTAPPYPNPFSVSGWWFVDGGMKHNRWIQLLLGLVCMIVISSPQYVWTLFTQPLMSTAGATLAQIQITFSVLIVIQTFLAPCQGLLVDRFGPRVLLSAGGALTGLSWVLAARATTLTGLYLTYGMLGGIGTGIVYVGVIG